MEIEYINAIENSENTPKENRSLGVFFAQNRRIE